MSTWATPAQLAAWLDTEAPANATALLRRASQLVTRATRNAVWKVGSNGLPANTDVAAALRDATCAQVETWIALGVDPIAGAAATSNAVLVSTNIGGASLTYAAPSAVTVEARARAADTLTSAAVDILDEAGLTTATVGRYA